MNLQELTKAKDEGKIISFTFDGDQDKAKSILQQIERVWPDVVWNDRGQKPTDLSWFGGRSIHGTISINYKLKNRIMKGISEKPDDITLTAQEFLAMTNHNIPENTQWIGEPFEFEGAWYREVKPQVGWWYEGKHRATDINDWRGRMNGFIACSGSLFIDGRYKWGQLAIPHPAPELSEKDKQIKLINQRIAELQAEAKKLEGMK